VEIVRNLRDTNIVKGQAWDFGLTSCASGCEVDYTGANLNGYQDRYLLYNNSFYNYNSGSPTLYKRKVIIDSSNVDVLKITIEVSWQEKSRSHLISVREDIYNWYQL